MREIAFIKQNKEKWLGIEQVISGNLKKNPDDLSSLYINLVNDLSFAQTYYPKSKTTIYLNHLSAQIFQKIYKTKRIEENKLKSFFFTEVPLLAYEYRRYLYYAFALFFLFTGIGVISAHFQPDFLKVIVGEDYVNETLENIKKGNPIAIYGTGSTWGSAIGIIANNLKVGTMMYVSGIFFGMGSVFYFLNNCIMLGSFQYFFQTQGVLVESARGIWVHGVFEIFAMVIETSAGLILGASILFPKTFSRVNSFKIGVKNSFKIFVSTIPFTIVAGFFEGFVTRHALEMPLILNLTLIFGMLGFIVFYYLFYPKMVYKNLNIKI